MRNQYIFNIPVYRKTKDALDTEIKNSIEKRVEWIISCDPKQRPLS